MANTPTRPSRAAGVFIAIGAILGAIIGTKTGQPTLGLLIGFGAGVAIALVLWLVDRRGE